MQPLNVYILLDRSGSMQNRWTETINSLNTYVNGLKEKNVSANVTVAAFDSGASIDFTLVRNNVSLYNFTNLSTSEITPNGGTPLFDAIGRIGSLATGEKATVIIMTDGGENSSKEMTKEGAKAVISRLETAGYDVIFIGADFNNFNEAANIGLAQNKAFTMTQGNYQMAMDSLTTRSASYSSGTLSGSSAISEDILNKAQGKI